MKVIIIDNYDSFSYNLFHLVEAILPEGWQLDIARNDAIGIDELGSYDKVIISPGPGLPQDAGISCEAIKKYYKRKSILGVCLGLQAITEVFGGRLLNLEKVLHGVVVPVQVTQAADYLFTGCPENFDTGRYHSWVADPHYLPSCLEVTAIDNNQQIMAVRHREFDVRGVQFHPESVMTPTGRKILQNWLLSDAGLIKDQRSFVKIDSLDPL